MNTTLVITSLAVALAAGYALGRVRPLRVARDKANSMLDYADLHGSQADEFKAIVAFLITHPIVGVTRTVRYYFFKVQGKQPPELTRPAGPEPRRPAPVYN